MTSVKHYFLVSMLILGFVSHSLLRCATESSPFTSLAATDSIPLELPVISSAEVLDFGLLYKPLSFDGSTGSIPLVLIENRDKHQTQIVRHSTSQTLQVQHVRWQI